MPVLSRFLNNSKSKKEWQILIIIFLFAIFLRFLYFPGNIYFGFDQARDAFAVQEILHGDFKVLGPTTSVEGLYHGSLYYYIFAPFYAIKAGDPVGVAIFLRILNASGVFLLFLLVKNLFNQKIALIASFLFALSFEQTQFAIYINHPSLSIISLLIYYLGWTLLLFKNNPIGFSVMMLGLGLSLQFEFVMIYLLPGAVVLGLVSIKRFRKLTIKNWVLGFLCLLLSLGSYLFAEIKYGFRSFQVLPSLLNAGSVGSAEIVEQLIFVFKRFFHYNLFESEITLLILVITLIAVYVFLTRPDHSSLGKTSDYRLKISFLLIWFASGFINYSKSYSTIPILHYGAGASISILIFFSIVIYQVFQRNKVAGLIVFLIPIISNLHLISMINPKGSLPEVNVQTGMLLSDQKKAIEFIYTEAKGQNFSVNALTMPFNVYTTWSYLFEWYGYQKYGYLPTWGGDAAMGYPGNLKIETARSKLPEYRFLISEPTRGIYPHLIEDFINNEDLFTKPVTTVKFGDIKVEKRLPY